MPGFMSHLIASATISIPTMILARDCSITLLCEPRRQIRSSNEPGAAERPWRDQVTLSKISFYQVHREMGRYETEL